MISKVFLCELAVPIVLGGPQERIHTVAEYVLH